MFISAFEFQTQFEFVVTYEGSKQIGMITLYPASLSLYSTYWIEQFSPGVWFKSWWHNQIETVLALLALLSGEFTGHRWIPLTGQWRGALMFSLICAWTKGCANNWDAGDLRSHRAHYDVSVMVFNILIHYVRLDRRRLNIVDKTAKMTEQ